MSMESKHPSLDDRGRFRLAVLMYKKNGKFDPASKDIYMNDVMKRRQDYVGDTAFINQTNVRVRRKLGTLVPHFDHLMAELNSRTDYEDKLDYLRGQLLLMKEAAQTMTEISDFHHEQSRLKRDLRSMEQLLVAGRELNMIEKEKNSSDRHVVAVAGTIVVVATVITAALKWRS